MKNLRLKKNKKAYFAGDFHLGRPNKPSSDKREKKIINWLHAIEKDAQEVFLMGDLFDFWFEYKYVIPKENLKFLLTISMMIEKGINFHYFIGNHDLWVINYFKNLGISVYDNPTTFSLDEKKIFVGHGDGLGKGDIGFKFIKKIFKNKLCQFLYRWIHPDLGIPLGRFLSGTKKKMIIEEKAKNNDKRIQDYCIQLNNKIFHDAYIFGHSHHINEEKISDKSTYFNCGEWINNSFYLESDGKYFNLKEFI